MAPAAKRRKTDQLQELNFDPSARQEYLTGFHKRKLQRIKHAQEDAAKQAREEKITARKELRDTRKADIERHVADVDALMRRNNSDIEDDADQVDGNAEEAGEWAGIEEAPKVDGTDEYIDEDKYTTVTIETVDDLRDLKGSEDEDDGPALVKPEVAKDVGDGVAKKKRIWYKEKPGDGKGKKRKQKFRYESKADRKQGRQKQKAKNSAAAKARKGD